MNLSIIQMFGHEIFNRCWHKHSVFDKHFSCTIKKVIEAVTFAFKPKYNCFQCLLQSWYKINQYWWELVIFFSTRFLSWFKTKVINLHIYITYLKHWIRIFYYFCRFFIVKSKFAMAWLQFETLKSKTLFS